MSTQMLDNRQPFLRGESTSFPIRNFVGWGAWRPPTPGPFSRAKHGRVASELHQKRGNRALAAYGTATSGANCTRSAQAAPLLHGKRRLGSCVHCVTPLGISHGTKNDYRHRHGL